MRLRFSFFDTLNVSPDDYEIDGPEVGSQFSSEWLGIVTEATKRAQYVLRSVRKDDNSYWKFSAQDPTGHTVPFLLDGDRNGHTQKMEGASRRLSAVIQRKVSYCMVGGEV